MKFTQTQDTLFRHTIYFLYFLVCHVDYQCSPHFKDVLITTMGTDYSQHECLTSSSFHTFHRMAPSLQQLQQLQLHPSAGANWGGERSLHSDLSNFHVQRHQIVTTAQICSYPEFVPIKVQCLSSLFHVRLASVFSLAERARSFTARQRTRTSLHIFVRFSLTILFFLGNRSEAPGASPWRVWRGRRSSRATRLLVLPRCRSTHGRWCWRRALGRPAGGRAATTTETSRPPMRWPWPPSTKEAAHCPGRGTWPSPDLLLRYYFYQ
jgi:hypothetical protein